MRDRDRELLRPFSRDREHTSCGEVFQPDRLNEILSSITSRRERAKSALERAKSHEAPQIRIDLGLIEEFGRDMRDTLTNGSIAFRKAYLQSLIDVIEVDDMSSASKGTRIYSKRPSWLAKAVTIRVRR
jgi:hypothetical protein